VPNAGGGVSSGAGEVGHRLVSPDAGASSPSRAHALARVAGSLVVEVEAGVVEQQLTEMVAVRA
jgi:hypothetical protein